MAAAWLVVALLAAVASATRAPVQGPQRVEIALSPDVSAGIVIGLFLLGILGVAVTLLTGIQTADKLGTTKPEINPQH